MSAPGGAWAAGQVTVATVVWGAMARAACEEEEMAA